MLNGDSHKQSDEVGSVESDSGKALPRGAAESSHIDSGKQSSNSLLTNSRVTVVRYSRTERVAPMQVLAELNPEDQLVEVAYARALGFLSFWRRMDEEGSHKLDERRWQLFLVILGMHGPYWVCRKKRVILVTAIRGTALPCRLQSWLGRCPSAGTSAVRPLPSLKRFDQ